VLALIMLSAAQGIVLLADSGELSYLAGGARSWAGDSEVLSCALGGS